MHPLRHPRNAALLGIIFIVIAIIYLVVPAALGQDLADLDIIAGVTMLLGLGHRDGDHGLRARGRDAGRMTRLVAVRTADRLTDPRCSSSGTPS